MHKEQDLSVVFDRIWQDLNAATQQDDHPYRTPVVANAVAKNNEIKAEQRVVVLRRCDDSFYRLFFFTDSRSAKYDQLQENSRLHWNFWNAETGEQLRIDSEVTLHHQNPLTRKEWESASPGSLKVYMNVLPSGHCLKSPEPPQALEPDKHYTHEELTAGQPFFVVVEAQVLNIDWLCIKTEPHQRAYFKRSEVTQQRPLTWEKHWSTP